MTSINDFSSVGRILRAEQDAVVFQPRNTTYEIRLVNSGKYDGPVGELIECMIRISARKVYTVPSGGNWIEPIAGPPRIVQGRIRYLDENQMVIQSGGMIVVDLPKPDDAFDLSSGPLTIGRMANVTVFPGARIEVLSAAAK